jgi:hypothetical protein
MTVVKETRQLQAVLETLCEKGFYQMLKPLFLQVELPQFKPVSSSKTPILRLIEAIQALGSPYIEFAHILSFRSDKLPISWCEAFSHLKTSSLFFPFEKVIAVIQTSLGGRIETYFSSIEKMPIKATFFSQTHKAKLTTGEAVFVEVARPEAEKEVEAAFEVVSHLAEQVYRAFDFAKESVVPLLDDLREALIRKLDFSKEIEKRERLESLFKKEREFRVPKVLLSYSGQKVITSQADSHPISLFDGSGLKKMIFEMGVLPAFFETPRTHDQFVLEQTEFLTLSYSERQSLAYLFMAFKEKNLFLAILALQRLSETPQRFLEAEVEEGLSSLILSEKTCEKDLLLFLAQEGISLNPVAYLALKHAILQKKDSRDGII